MNKRRGHGEGSVFQRADGRWVGVADLGVVGGRRRRKYVYGERQADVIAELRNVREQLAKGLPAPDDQLTVNHLLDQWYADVLRHQVAPSAYENYTLIADKHVRPALGRKRVAKLTPADVDALMSAKLDEGLSVSTVRRIRAVLAQALGQAERWGLVARNVASVTRGPRERRKEGRTLTPPQVQTLLGALETHRLGALYLTMLGLGLRRGEALGLRWVDVDLDRATLIVQRALKYERVDGKATLVLGEVKTAKSRRALNVPAPVVDALRSQRARQAADRLAAGSAWDDAGLGLVFTTALGGPLDPRNIYRDFTTLCERAGLGRWHPHELRHSAASIMLAEGVPIEVVSDVLGHSSIRMTADVYAHLLEPQRKAAADAMAAALGR
jgi:integrase